MPLKNFVQYNTAAFITRKKSKTIVLKVYNISAAS